MSNKKNGVKKSVASTAYKTVKSELAQLESHMNQLVKDVEQMNKESFYNGEYANEWYKRIKGHYHTYSKGNLYKFYTGVEKFQNNLYDLFHKASAKGINF